MSRRADNINMINHYLKLAVEYPKGDMKEMLLWHLCAITMVLMDISESLAVIADNAESEE